VWSSERADERPKVILARPIVKIGALMVAREKAAPTGVGAQD